jgi:hypothetical protein
MWVITTLAAMPKKQSKDGASHGALYTDRAMNYNPYRDFSSGSMTKGDWWALILLVLLVLGGIIAFFLLGGF